MYLSTSPLLIYILTIYSFIFLLRSKTKNEFLLIFTIFIFLEAKSSWQNSIISIITKPINVRAIDIPLLILIYYIINAFIKSKTNIVNEIFNISKTFFIFFVLIIFYTILGIAKFGYASIAEFRLLFFYIIVVLFIISNIKKVEIIILVKKIAEYLIPLILLIPINIILTKNPTISADNRALGAFIYETITMGYIAGYFYWKYIDRKFKLFTRFVPAFLVFSIWANVRTVWAIIFAAIVFKIIFEEGKIKTTAFILFFLFVINASNFININYLEQRAKALSNISEDTSGKWRLYIWEAVIKDASFLGKGIGARFKVYADVIGYAAENGAHNGFIRILHNLGYLGLFIIVLLFVSFIIKFLKIIHLKSSLSPERNMMYKLSLMSVISLFLYMMGYGPDLVSWVFITFGLKLYNQKVYNEKLLFPNKINNI